MKTSNMSSVQNLITLRDSDFAFGETDLCELTGRIYIPNQCILLLCKEGRGVVTINSGKRVIRKGDFAVLFSDAPLSIVDLSPEFRADYLHFSSRIMEKIYYNFTSESFWVIMSGHQILRPTSEQYGLLQGWFRQMEWMMAHGREDCRITVIQNTLFNLFLMLEGELLRHFPASGQNRGKDRAWMMFGKFMSLLIEHCHEVREVSFYADKLCITTDYLYKICNKIEHQTPKTIIDNVVTGEIKQYLSDTDLSIKEIAQEFRFDETSYLAHFFRRMTGLSPIDYRGEEWALVWKNTYTGRILTTAYPCNPLNFAHRKKMCCMITDYIAIIHERCKLRESPHIIGDFFRELYFNGPLPGKQLSQKLRLPVPIVTALKKEGIGLGMCEQCCGGVRLTPAGRLYVEQEMGYEGIDRRLYNDLTGNGEAREAYANSLSRKYESAFEDRPAADVTFDQAQCTVLTAFRRALLCLVHGSLIGKRILCLGDDDFVSLAIGFLLKELYPGKSSFPTDVCVLDVDERYLDTLRRTARQHGLPVRCERTDLRDPLPGHLSGRFDCLFTDPPYTREGASLFLSRGISALKKEQGQKVFFSFGNKPADENFLLQKCFQLHGLNIKEILDMFNEYNGASLLGNTGRMYVLETTQRTRAVLPDTRNGRKDIYTADRYQKHSLYRCKQCGRTYPVGQGEQFGTISELKAKGCPACGCRTFRRRHNEVKPATSVSLPFGYHILADFYGCDTASLDDVERISNFMHEAALKARATIVQENFHKFAPVGVSGVVVIQESHLAIHTWPECRYAAVDLFTCGTSVNPWAAFDYLQERLGADNVEYSDLVRGIRTLP